MTEFSRDLATYRIKRALETLEDARVLAQSSRWNACVNRLYYACFYAVSALLLQKGLSSSKHTGVRSLFNQHYVKPRNVPRERLLKYTMISLNAVRRATIWTLLPLKKPRYIHGLLKWRRL